MWLTILHMFQDYTLHTHSIGFDGRDSVQAMINRAREMGFRTIGISNHFIVNPIIKDSKMYSYAVQGGYSNIYSSSFNEVMSRFVPHYVEIEKLREQNPDMKILRGMEVDFFGNNKWRDGFEKAIQILKPDYTIGSAHFVEYGGTLLNTHDWKSADQQDQNEILKFYWEDVANAALSGLFTWLAHLDLPKKAGLGIGDEWEEFEEIAVQSAAHTNTAIEINTSFYRKYLYEPYPSNRVLKMMAKNNVPTLLSDDAHNVENIGRHFDEAAQLIRQFGLKKFQR